MCGEIQLLSFVYVSTLQQTMFFCSVCQGLSNVPRSNAEHPQVPSASDILPQHLPQLHDHH